MIGDGEGQQTLNKVLESQITTGQVLKLVIEDVLDEAVEGSSSLES